MVTANIVQISDAGTTAVNVGREQRMKIHEVIRLRNAYGGETTLDELVSRMQGNKIHRCPKCGGSGTTIKRVNRAQY